jgi:hypothetical protein
MILIETASTVNVFNVYYLPDIQGKKSRALASNRPLQPGVNVIKLFTSVIYEFFKQYRVLSL